MPATVGPPVGPSADARSARVIIGELEPRLDTAGDEEVEFFDLVVRQDLSDDVAGVWITTRRDVAGVHEDEHALPGCVCRADDERGVTLADI